MLSVTADMGRMYSIQTSSNLVQWQTLSEVFNQQTSFQLLDSAAGAGKQGQRFYRVRWSTP